MGFSGSRKEKVTTELHRHLDASIRPATLLKLAQNKGLEGQSTSVTAFTEKLILKTPLPNLNSVLEKFKLFQFVLDSPEILEQVAYEAVEDCQSEGLRQVELRYSPSFVSEHNALNWEDILDAFETGIQKATQKYPIKVGLICIAVRDHGLEQVEKTIEFFLKYKARFVGLDLAGQEKKYPCKLYENAFAKAIKIKAHITIHAGEDSGPENIWQAIALLGAQRIGHGISFYKDPQLTSFLSSNSICLEMCPTSNWITQAVKRLSEHPIKKALESNIAVCINTDDPGIFGNSMPYEEKVCLNQVGLKQADIKKCRENALKHSFI